MYANIAAAMVKFHRKRTWRRVESNIYKELLQNSSENNVGEHEFMKRPQSPPLYAALRRNQIKLEICSDTPQPKQTCMGEGYKGEGYKA